MSRKPDRFERSIKELEYMKKGADKQNILMCESVDVLKLLRREHQAVRRLITRKPFSLNPTMAATDWGKGYIEASRDILAALDARRK